MIQAMLSVENINKSYAQPVLKNISLVFEAGEIHALIGENGAGKSTLINIMCGAKKPNSGILLLAGASYAPAHPIDAHKAGVAWVAQELSLVDELSVAENLMLRDLPSTMTGLNTRDLLSKCLELLPKLGLEIDDPLKTKVESLSLSEKQTLEIAKGLAFESKVLILDEPTAAMPEQQSARVLEVLKEQARAGAAIIFVSHRLEEVLSFSDKVSVLRDGEIVETFASKQLTTDQLLKLMSGEKGVDTAQLVETASSQKKPYNARLSVEGLTSDDFTTPVSLAVKAGEVLGIAGLAGSGRTELLDAIYGLVPRKKGRVVVSNEAGDEASIITPSHSARFGIGYLTEDRKQSGILSYHSLTFNADLARIGTCKGKLAVWHKREAANRTAASFEELCVDFADLEQSIETLSGGNQQKILFARWLQVECQFLLLDEPSRGVDVAAKSLIHQHIHHLRDIGVGIIVASSDTEELMRLSDRILILSGREVASTLPKSQFAYQSILEASFSAHMGMPAESRTSPDQAVTL